MRSPAKIRPISVAGPLLLLAVVGIIGIHALRWHVVAEALGRRVRLMAIDGRFMDIELDRLQLERSSRRSRRASWTSTGTGCNSWRRERAGSL